MATTKNEKMTTRVTTENKRILETALALSGFSSLNSFIVDAAVEKAKKLIEHEMVIKLCQQDAIAFVEALNAPATVTPRFLKAATAYQEHINNGNHTAR